MPDIAHQGSLYSYIIGYIIGHLLTGVIDFLFKCYTDCIWGVCFISHTQQHKNTGLTGNFSQLPYYLVVFNANYDDAFLIRQQ